MDKLKDRDLGGALAGDTIFRSAVRSLRNIFISASSTPGTQSRAYLTWVIINKTGLLDITETELSALSQITSTKSKSIYKPILISRARYRRAEQRDFR